MFISEYFYGQAGGSKTPELQSRRVKMA